MSRWNRVSVSKSRKCFGVIWKRIILGEVEVIVKTKYETMTGGQK